MIPFLLYVLAVLVVLISWAFGVEITVATYRRVRAFRQCRQGYDAAISAITGYCGALALVVIGALIYIGLTRVSVWFLP